MLLSNLQNLFRFPPLSHRGFLFFFFNCIFLNSHVFYSIFSFFGQVACGILVPQPGIEPEASALEARNLNHWTPGKSPEVLFPTHLAFHLALGSQVWNNSSVFLCLLWPWYLTKCPLILVCPFLMTEVRLFIFFFNFYLFIFIFGCVRSSFLCEGFL